MSIFQDADDYLKWLDNQGNEDEDFDEEAADEDRWCNRLKNEKDGR
jgi:hypothetical protein